MDDLIKELRDFAANPFSESLGDMQEVMAKAADTLEALSSQWVSVADKDKHIAELEAKLDAVVEWKQVIKEALQAERSICYDDESNDAVCEALAAIESLQQPASGEQEK